MDSGSFHPLLMVLIAVSPAVGSFLALLVDRVPRGESVVHPRSFCRSCGKRLALTQLVPLVSFVHARGKCRHCGGQIPTAAIRLELGALLAALAAALVAGDVAVAWLSAAALWCLIALAEADAAWTRLPDILTAPLLAFSVGLAALGVQPLSHAILGACLGAGSFLALRLAYQALRGREGLGLGDVKLMAGIGALVPLLSLPWVVLVAALAALGWAGVSAARAARPLRATQALPFGTFLSLAAIVVWLWQRLAALPFQ